MTHTPRSTPRKATPKKVSPRPGTPPPLPKKATPKKVSPKDIRNFQKFESEESDAMIREDLQLTDDERVGGSDAV